MKKLEKLLKIKIKRPFGIFLSGGLDSAILAAILKPDIAISVGYNEGEKYNELSYARRIVKHIGIKEHTIVIPEKQNIRQDLNHAIQIIGEPINSVSIYSWYQAMKTAKQTGIKRWVGGEGADELFGGYARYIILNRIAELYRLEELENYHPMLNKLFGSVSEIHSRLVDQSTPEYPIEGTIGAIGKWEYENTLPDIILMEEKLSEHFGIELNLPYMQKSVKQYAIELPESEKIRGTLTKPHLRELAYHLLKLPYDIAFRKSKMGFVSPIMKWLKLNKSNYEFDKREYLNYQAEVLNVQETTKE